MIVRGWEARAERELGDVGGKCRALAALVGKLSFILRAMAKVLTVVGGGGGIWSDLGFFFF